MDDALLVGGLEAFGDLAEEGEGFAQRQWPPRDALGEGLTGNELHDEKAPGGALAP